MFCIDSQQIGPFTAWTEWLDWVGELTLSTCNALDCCGGQRCSIEVLQLANIFCVNLNDLRFEHQQNKPNTFEATKIILMKWCSLSDRRHAGAATELGKMAKDMRAERLVANLLEGRAMLAVGRLPSRDTKRQKFA
jgi:hypothetical protein